MGGSTLRRRTTKLRSSHNYGSSKPSSTKTASALLSSSRPSSETNRTRTPKARAVALERCTVKSSGTRSQSHLSAASHERARMSWQQPCYCVACLNLPTPRRGAFETRCRLCSKWRQFSGPRARPLDVEEQPRRSVMSRPRTKRRCRSISSRPLEERTQHSSSTTPSTISDDTTHDATSTRIVTVDVGTLKSAVTAPTAAGDTTAKPFLSDC